MRKLLRHGSLRIADDVLEQSLEALTAFFRAEAFAAHTYETCLARCPDERLKTELVRLRNSHAGRALILRERVQEFGGNVLDKALEPWGAFAPIFVRVVGAQDDREMVIALRDGESWAVRDYEMDLGEVEPHLRQEIARIVLSEQRRTREQIKHLLDSTRAEDDGETASRTSAVHNSSRGATHH